MTTKYCKSCNSIKDVEDFARNNSTKTGCHAYCKVCIKRKNKEDYQKRRPHKDEITNDEIVEEVPYIPKLDEILLEEITEHKNVLRNAMKEFEELEEIKKINKKV
jgi:hypothetical protein